MNIINWFDIPVTDIERAVKFYNNILEADMTIVPAMPDMPARMAFFPITTEGGGLGGALMECTDQNHMAPSNQGTHVYFNGGEDLETILTRVSGAGGKVLLPKTSIGEHGFIALFIDSEGNKVGLHSM